jgi:UDP-2,3-diacylglucosamine pyrophosphatase LpxH
MAAMLGYTMFNAAIESTLKSVYDAALHLPLTDSTRLVIFSDLHMGNGGPRDDFQINAPLVEAALQDWYLARDFGLVLDGDIEELQRFRFDDIHARWAGLYALFESFRARTVLYKIVGNHDEGLLFRERVGVDRDLLGGIRLERNGNTLFVFHGHQATIFFERFNDVSGFFLKYVANTLRIRNFPVALESQKKYRTEHRVYAFSASRKILSVIGHTHRPLFESLSKIDTIRFRIEQLCREYPAATDIDQTAIAAEVDGLKQELGTLWDNDREDGLRSSLYNDRIIVPSLFNSGCAIGKHGVTAIEIADGGIALVHWFDRYQGSRHLEAGDALAEQLGTTGFYRTVIKEDRLDYIFARIRLLA